MSAQVHGFNGTELVIPQTVLALRGSDGVAKEGAMVPSWVRSWTRSLIFLVIYSTW